MAYHRSRSLGVGAKIIRRRKSLTSICHCSKDRSISLTLIIYPPNTQLLHSLAQFLHKFIPFFCVFHLGFGLVNLHIRAINHALTNIPRDRVRLHVCWGNSEGPHHYDVPLEDILDLLYGAKVGALVMEMANPRHAHEHRVYPDHPLPEGMLLVAGVIDTKTNYVEHPRLVADRLHQAVAAAGGDPTRVLAGADCGFDTSAGSNRVDEGIVWLKLRAMRKGADIASRELF